MALIPFLFAMMFGFGSQKNMIELVFKKPMRVLKFIVL